MDTDELLTNIRIIEEQIKINRQYATIALGEGKDDVAAGRLRRTVELQTRLAQAANSLRVTATSYDCKEGRKWIETQKAAA